MSDELLLTTGRLEIEAAASSDRPATISGVAYAGGVLAIGGSRYIIDLAGLTLPASVPLLRDHENQVGAIVGTVKASVHNNSLPIEGVLARGVPAADEVIALSKAGVELGVSVGVEPEQRTYISPTESIKANGQAFTADANGLIYVSKSNLREISLVPVGADRTARAAIAASQGKATKMSTENETIITTPDPLLAAWDQPGLTASERVLARWNGTTFGDSNIRSDAERFLHAALSGKMTFDQFDREILKNQLRDAQVQAMRAARPTAPGIRASSHDAAIPAIEAALLCHLGGEHVAAKLLGDQATQTARNMRLTSMVEILQAAWSAAGMDAPRGRDQLIKASFSTAAISNIVSGVQGKLLLDQWQRLPILSRTLAKKLSASDFKQSRAVRLAARNVSFTQLGEAGEIEHGHLTDSSATFQIATYARMYALTRESIVNDDLGAFAEMPQIIARGAGLKIESVFWTLVLANTGSFFAEANGNSLTDALDIDGLGAAVALMRALTDADGEPILAEPKYLVVPPSLEATADALFASTNIVIAGTGAAVTTQPAGSPYAGKYMPMVSPYLSNANYSGNSETGWYLFADPSAVAAFGVAYLNGQESPVVEQQDAPFDQLGVQFRGYIDFGVCQLDTQGAVFSSGDA